MNGEAARVAFHHRVLAVYGAISSLTIRPS
jgi:hypothetical protein